MKFLHIFLKLSISQLILLGQKLGIVLLKIFPENLETFGGYVLAFKKFLHFCYMYVISWKDYVRCLSSVLHKLLKYVHLAWVHQWNKMKASRKMFLTSNWVYKHRTQTQYDLWLNERTGCELKHYIEDRRRTVKTLNLFHLLLCTAEGYIMLETGEVRTSPECKDGEPN